MDGGVVEWFQSAAVLMKDEFHSWFLCGSVELHSPIDVFFYVVTNGVGCDVARFVTKLE